MFVFVRNSYINELKLYVNIHILYMYNIYSGVSRQNGAHGKV